jgi:peptidoglycan/LPS O-acetylase OafA/YrhL
MFLNYVHQFRGIAILFIISGHCIRFFSWENSPQIEKIVKVIMLNGTVMFVFIAGFLFQHLSRKYTYGQYLKNKLKYVIAPYIFVSIPMVWYVVFVQKLGHWSCPNLEKESYIIQVVWFYLTGKHLAPLWFIPMITVFYFLYPLFTAIDNRKLLYVILLPSLLLMSIVVHRAPGETNLLHVTAHFLAVYLLGMWFSRHKDILFPIIERYLPFLILLVLGIIFTEFIFYQNVGVIYVTNVFDHEKELININLFQKLLLSLILMHLLKKHDASMKRLGISTILKTIATLSFGIYFVHYYFIDALLRTRRIFQYSVEGNLVFLMMLILVIGVISVLSIKIAQLIFKNKSRYFIGC